LAQAPNFLKVDIMIFKTPKGPIELATLQDLWTTISTITVAQAALAVGARDAATVAALAATKTAVYEMPPWGNAVEFRFQTTADADAHIVNHYVMRGKTDHWDLATILGLTGGKQKADGAFYFVDTITVTETFLNAGTVVHSAADGIGRYVLDACGYSGHLFIATTLQGSSTLTPQVATY